MRNISVIILFIASCVLSVSAQTIGRSGRLGVIESIESGSKVVVKQDPKLDKLINDYLNDSSDGSTPYAGVGYRVQVFSSNAQKTAKDESLTIERRLRSAFPEYGVYRIYSSPFWKVRIGDFRTMEDAQQFRNEIVKAFPELKRETYTVRENKISIR